MTKRVLSARANGSLGGLQGSRLLSDEQREERARKAGNGTLSRYGRDYFSFLRKSTNKNSKKTSSVVIPQPRLSTAAKRFAGMAS